MNQIGEQIAQRIDRMKASTLAQNRANGLEKLFRQNTFNMLIESSRLWLMAVREEDKEIEEYTERVNDWYHRVLDLDTYEDLGLALIAGDVFSQMGYLFGRKPNQREIEYIAGCRKSPDFMNPMSAISYNLYLGDKPTNNLPTKFDKRRQKDTDDTIALLMDPKQGLISADKMWERRAKMDMHHWYGTGPAHAYLLDPLILCILKYHKADFESDSIHMKGYRFLAKHGF